MKIYLFLFTMLFLSACSRLDLAVSFAPRFISNEVDEALDLDSDRYKKMKAVIAGDIEKNKDVLFSEIITQVEYLLMLTGKKEISPDEVRFIFQELKDLQKRTVYSFKSSFAEVLMPISKNEIGHLNNYVSEKYSKSDAMFSDKNKFYRHYFKGYDHYVNMLFDSSSKDQDKLFHDFLDANIDYYRLRNKSRMASLKQFDYLFEKKEELLDYNLKFYAGENVTKSEEFIKKQESFNNNMLVFVSKFWNEASLSQKNHFRKYLLEMKEELKKIITKV